MTAVEKDFAPTLKAVPPVTISETARVGEFVVQVSANPGLTVLGVQSTIVDFQFTQSNGTLIGHTDESGRFKIDKDGRVTVASRNPGTDRELVLRIAPINDAGQQEGDGSPRSGIRGFFPVNQELRRSVLVTVEARRPIAADDRKNTSAGVPTLVEVTLNDVEGGDAESILLTSNPSNGTATVSGLAVLYTPNPGFSGEDTFSYVARNSAGDSAPATVTVTVVPEGGAVAISIERYPFMLEIGCRGLVSVKGIQPRNRTRMGFITHRCHITGMR
jgi:hypothetical protein